MGLAEKFEHNILFYEALQRTQEVSSFLDSCRPPINQPLLSVRGGRSLIRTLHNGVVVSKKLESRVPKVRRQSATISIIGSSKIKKRDA